MWPDDNEPRFIVTSLRGRQIRPGMSGGNSKSSMPVCAQVIDRAYAHRLVKEFYAAPRKNAAGFVIANAERYAAELNAKDAA